MVRSSLALSTIGLGLVLGCTSSAAGPTEVPPGRGQDAGEADADVAGQLPCAVDQVLAGHCRQCHSSPPQFGAPMPLVTLSDLLAPAKSNPAVPVYEMIETRIHDDGRPMPQPPNPRLGAADTATLDAWIAAGAPPAASGDTCATDSGTTNDGGVVNPLSCTPDTHLAPASAWSMPTNTNDIYVCYGVDVPVSSKRQVIGFEPNVVNRSIVHHVLLFQTPNSVSGTPAPCGLGGVGSGRIVYGWAPGGQALELPPQVGFPEEGVTHYVVQVHYNNINHLAGQTDTTGFDLCTTSQLRPNDADVIAFGTTSISIPPHASLDETCSFTLPAGLPTLNAFLAWPHMHQLGTTISTEQLPGGSGAGVDMGTVANWNFQTQGWLPITGTLNPGDVLKTRCAWDNTTSSTVTYGPYTENEMCFSFTMYYPRVTSWNWSYPANSSVCGPTQ